MAVQINARISESTKELLERECRATGIKKEFLVEEALLHHLQALHELPADVIIHPRLLISAETAEALLEQIESPAPTQALKDLMKRHGD
ncbi:MAG TPA: hypothetical protein V6D47_10695 [Oscillatoriaceae cyanobacterium]